VFVYANDIRHIYMCPIISSVLTRYDIYPQPHVVRTHTEIVSQHPKKVYACTHLPGTVSSVTDRRQVYTLELSGRYTA